MKKLTRLSAILLTLCMLIGAVPFAYAAEEDAYRLPVQKITTEYSAVLGPEYFGTGCVVYDENGDVYTTFAVNEYIFSIGANVIVTADEVNMTYRVYNLSTLELVSVYDANNTAVIPYMEGGLYTVLLTMSETGEGVCRHIMDASGNVIVNSDGTEYDLSFCLEENIIVSLNITQASLTADVEIMNGNTVAKKLTVEDMGLVEHGVFWYTQNGKVGLMNTEGKVLAHPVYASARTLENGYTIAYRTMNSSTQERSDSEVLDTDGKVVYSSSGYVEFYDGNVVAEWDSSTLKYTVTRLETGETVAVGEAFSEDGGFYYVSDNYENAGNVYDKDWGVVVEDVFGFSVDENGKELVVWADDTGASDRYSIDGTYLYSYDVCYAEAFADGVVCGWNEEDYGALAEGSRVFTDWHYVYSDRKAYFGCEAYVFVDEDDTSTLYIVKKGPSPFEDVDQWHWAHENVVWAYEEGIMNGMEDTVFAPDGTVTRAQVVTVLWRMSGSPEPTGQLGGGYFDVEMNRWYTDAVAWARETGVVKGMSDDEFAPDDPVTREQFATMLFRYAEKIQGKDTSARAELSSYVDANEVERWANDAVQWCVAEGHIKGVTSELLAPSDNLTRAQLATVVHRFFKSN